MLLDLRASDIFLFSVQSQLNMATLTFQRRVKLTTKQQNRINQFIFDNSREQTTEELDDGSLDLTLMIRPEDGTVVVYPMDSEAVTNSNFVFAPALKTRPTIPKKPKLVEQYRRATLTFQRRVKITPSLYREMREFVRHTKRNLTRILTLTDGTEIMIVIDGFNGSVSIKSGKIMVGKERVDSRFVLDPPLEPREMGVPEPKRNRPPLTPSPTKPQDGAKDDDDWSYQYSDNIRVSKLKPRDPNEKWITYRNVRGAPYKPHPKEIHLYPIPPEIEDPDEMAEEGLPSPMKFGRTECQVCDKKATHICGNCKKIAYCGLACQNRHWISSHSRVCQ
jgi:hypothetical protein